MVVVVSGYFLRLTGMGWDMKADVVLQAADYVLWAVMREVERGDKRSRVLIEDKVRSVYDLWSRGGKHYYGRLAA